MSDCNDVWMRGTLHVTEIGAPNLNLEAVLAANGSRLFFPSPIPPKDGSANAVWRTGR